MAISVSSAQNAKIFGQFDVVSGASDHSYVTNRDTGGQSQKKIMKEWRILEKDLPDSIFVRVYEDRIDLMRVVIIGAPGTPYHDSLHFFDIAFPSSYPSQPLLVRYRSFGFNTINPNLHTSGRVCLSLLNTWPGRKTERWNPEQSTVLQVLVSIQGLILREKPLFNVPGFGWISTGGSGSFWDNASNSYNAEVFVTCCKTTLLHLRRPPEHFENFVADHFKERGHAILSACVVYANGGTRIGNYNYNYNYNFSSSIDLNLSPKFKRSIEELYPELLEAFVKVGAPLGTNLMEQFKVEEKKTTPFLGKKKSNGGIVKRFVGKLKKVFGFSKKIGKGSVKWSKQFLIIII